MTVAAVGAAGRAATAAGGARAATGAGGRAATGTNSGAAGKPAGAGKTTTRGGQSRSRSPVGDMFTEAAGGSAQGAAMSRGLRGPRRRAAGPGTTPRRLLVAEFALCMVVLALSPISDQEMKPQGWMKRATAIMAVFFVLGLVASGGRGASRAAAAFGGLVTLTLAVSNRSIFTVVASKMTTTDDEVPPASPGPDVPDVDDQYNGNGQYTSEPPGNAADPGAEGR